MTKEEKLEALRERRREHRHYREIKKLEKEFIGKPASTGNVHRAIWLFLFILASFIILFFMLWMQYVSKNLISIFNWRIFIKPLFDNSAYIGIVVFLIFSPILFIIWVYHDRNRVKRLEQIAHDTHLKEFHQLQQWATGNIFGIEEANGNSEILQISALHKLRDYLKGSHGEDFKRVSFEIFRSVLGQVNKQVKEEAEAGEEECGRLWRPDNHLYDQLHTIIEEDWFFLLVNHDFSMSGMSLYRASLINTYLVNRDFNNADFAYANLLEVNLSDSNLLSADLTHANLRKTNLSSARLSNANLAFATVLNADLTYANLRKANLADARLSGSDLSHAILWHADLMRANLRKVNLDNAILVKANLASADLSETDFSGADLTKANLSEANLTGANFYQANLSGARLVGAILKDTNLEGVDLSNVDLSQAKIIDEQ